MVNCNSWELMIIDRWFSVIFSRGKKRDFSTPEYEVKYKRSIGGVQEEYRRSTGSTGGVQEVQEEYRKYRRSTGGVQEEYRRSTGSTGGVQEVQEEYRKYRRSTGSTGGVQEVQEKYEGSIRGVRTPAVALFPPWIFYNMKNEDSSHHV